MRGARYRWAPATYSSAIADSPTSPIDPRPLPHPPPRWVLPLAGTVIVTLLVLGWISGASWVKLIESSPVTLLALAPANRNLLLVTNSLDAWTYYGVGLVRHMLPDPAFYLLGFWYGRKAIAWASEDNPGVERMFGPDGSALLKPGAQKALAVAAIVAPNNWVSLACGAARIPMPYFFALNLAGTSLRLWVCRWLGGIFEEEIRGFADWVGRYQNPILIASIAVVMVLVWVQGRKAAHELSGLAHLRDDD